MYTNVYVLVARSLDRGKTYHIDMSDEDEVRVRMISSLYLIEFGVLVGKDTTWW